MAVVAVVALAGCNRIVTRGNNGSSHAAISGDGRSIAFQSLATDLAPGDTNGRQDIFVWDRSSDATIRVTDGNADSGDDLKVTPSLSHDGGQVAFASDASDLVPGDTNGHRDVFVWARDTRTTTQITHGDGVSNAASISGDGRIVAFCSRATNLVPGVDGNGHRDVFVWDRSTGTTTRVTLGDLDTRCPSVSADGRYVSFASRASRLVVGDTNWQYDVFVWDRLTGATTRITDGDDESNDPVLSADGRYVAYASYATNLVPGDTNGQYDIFVWDRRSGGTIRITDGDRPSERPSISGDGRFVSFESMATDLVPGDTDTRGRLDVFVWDRSTGATTRLTAGNHNADRPRISSDGRHVAFWSFASDLVSDDANGNADVFTWRRSWE